MNIGLIDVDSHNFPNFAMMRISAYYKTIGANIAEVHLSASGASSLQISFIQTRAFRETD